MAQGSFYYGAGQRNPSHFDSGQGIPVSYHASWSRCCNCVVTWNAIPVRTFARCPCTLGNQIYRHAEYDTEWSDVVREGFPFILNSAHRRPITVVVVDWLSYTRTAINQFSSTISCFRHSSFKCSCESRRVDPASLS